MSFDFSTYADLLQTGLVGTLGYQVKNSAGTIIVPFTKTGVRVAGPNTAYTAGIIALPDAAALIQWGNESGTPGIIGTILASEPVLKPATLTEILTGQGSVAVTIHLEDEDGNVLPNIPVEIVGTAFMQLSNDDGDVVYNRDPSSSFTVRFPEVTGYVHHDDVVINVPASGSSYTAPTIEFESLTSAEPSSPSKCLVEGWFKNADGTYPEGTIFTFELVAPHPTSAGRVFVERTVQQAVDEDGYLRQELDKNSVITPAGTRWHVKCDGMKVRPNTRLNLTTANYNISSLVTA